MKTIYYLLLLAVTLAACQDKAEWADDPSDGDEEAALSAEQEKAVASQMNVFAFRLLQTVVDDEEPDKNILISPFSASIGLGMLNNGANGQTQKDLQKVLNAPDLSKEELNRYFRNRISAVRQADPGVSFEIANSVWIDKNFSVLENFIKVNATWFDAEVRNEAFADKQTVELVNDWCAGATQGKIPRIIDELSDQAVVLLINALYLKAAWTVPFPKENTKVELFHNTGGSEVSVPMMQMDSIYFNYAEAENFELLELPYGNESFSMNILLPRQGITLESLMEKLGENTWQTALSHLKGTKISVKLPRFGIEYGKDLKESIINMGATTIRGGNADFSLINPDKQLSVSRVLQKSLIEVNEEGTEAASVTLVEVGISLGGTLKVPLFQVDRPFLFIIREKASDAALLMGVVRNL
jgi:serpin B